ncbi:MAG: Holliday junction resolvase RuvX [Micromonosporaceae bacterium]|nr:Holliday junction resolvase RuvX [Micromonosporaceae bacterium]
MEETGRGVRLGVDVGTVRVGVAVSDPDGILATPLMTIARGRAKPAEAGSDLDELVRLVREHSVVEVIVGLPVTLAGQDGPAATAARGYAEALAIRIDPVPVRMTDERMTTVVASRRLAERGVRGRRQRAVVDQAAAVEILQCWLESRSIRGRRGGGERAD